MRRQTVIPRKKRGPPATGKGTPIMVRLQPEPLSRLDHWASQQDDQPSRPEAIRRLFDLGLSHSAKRGRLSHEARKKASAMAGETVDRLTDASAPIEEREKRKRKLIKGPLEFRDIRQDQVGTKLQARGKKAR
jgi:hypothetical protein